MDIETVTVEPLQDCAVADEITLVHTRAFAVGVDVGQAHDPTAICIVSRVESRTLNPMLAQLNPYKAPRYEVQHLERLPLGKAYPQQVDRVEQLMLRPPLVQPTAALLIDYTGVGRPVFDMFAQSRALRYVQGVVITSGRDTTHTHAGWAVPKGELVSRLQALLHAGRLRIAARLPDAAVLARELQDFRVRFTEAGNATFNAREGAHDDLVLALALAVFGLGRPKIATELAVRWAR